MYVLLKQTYCVLLCFIFWQSVSKPVALVSQFYCVPCTQQTWQDMTHGVRETSIHLFMLREMPKWKFWITKSKRAMRKGSEKAVSIYVNSLYSHWTDGQCAYCIHNTTVSIPTTLHGNIHTYEFLTYGPKPWCSCAVSQTVLALQYFWRDYIVIVGLFNMGAYMRPRWITL